MKRPGVFVSSFVLGLLAIAADGFAAGRARYRLELSDGSRWTAVDAPAVHGSVLTFHTTDGTLVGVPREMVARIASLGRPHIDASLIRSVAKAPTPVEDVADESTVIAPETLQPGDVVVLGPLTEIGPTLAEATAATAAVNATVAPAGAPAAYPGQFGYGGGVNPNLYVNPNGTLFRAPSSTDLALALAAQTPVGANGFPVTTNGSPTVIGPNGTPTLAPGVPGSATPAIGPNGTPVIGETGTAFPPIGPNGTPVLAPGGQAGSAPVVIGPNGTPELSPTVPTASTPVVIGPNGTPVLAPGGQAGSTAMMIGPNGTPVLAPSGQPGSGSVVIGPNGTPAAAPMRSAAPAGHGGGRGR